jgi:hypothetical protein
MRIFIFFVFFISPHIGLSRVIWSTVHSIDRGKKNEVHLVRLDNGRVAFLVEENKTFLQAFLLSHERQEMLKITVDGKNRIESVQTVTTDSIQNEVPLTDIPVYRPSVLRDYKTSVNIFQKMRGAYNPDGECFSRAHVWVYEEFQRSGLFGMKTFMFFTESYIRRYNYHWWFHVTPMYYVGSLNSPRVFDRRYTTGPIQLKTWSDIFIFSKRACKVVQRFDDFWLHQQKEDCYHIHSSMYYFIPRDLEKRDLSGKEKSEFIGSEIRKSYRDGFNIVLPK